MENIKHMEFFLFTTNADLALSAEEAGVDSIIVDWENKGKQERQNGHNLEINANTPQDVYRLSKILHIPVTVRINALGEHTPIEVESAIDNGARILMLPMAYNSKQVEEFLSIVNKRAKTIIQIETPSLTKDLASLKKLRWNYVYIGLNDLMVAKGGHSIWEALLDGTAEKICNALQGRSYGFGGSTILGGGEPIINILILHELIRLGGSISVMRRTFKKELLDRNLKAEIKLLRNFIKCSKQRGVLAKKHDHEHLHRIINKIINFEEILI